MEFSAGPLRGDITVPGDKSISHRALILGAATSGPLNIANLNPGRDVGATRQALSELGIRIDGNKTQCVVHGGELHDPVKTLDCMNSGTTARLMMGVCSGAGLTAELDGDESLQKRPMEPVAAQLRAFGARIETAAGLLPAMIHGTAHPQTRRFILVSPSAQVKSALLLCALFAKTSISISGDRGSRDHTERMLEGFGASIKHDATSVTYEYTPIQAGEIAVPGDFSAAAFFMVAATITPGSDITIRDVGVNPTRTGLLDALREMGASIEITNPRLWANEPVADIHVCAAPLHGITIGPELALRSIDEILVLSVAAARAGGSTKITGIRELRTKESDRIAAISRILQTVDVSVETLPNGIEIAGGSGSPGKGRVLTQGDHRTAMSVAALAAAAGPLSIDDAAGIDVSFPGFQLMLEKAQA
ncbi:MAG: 3-phosphoshikimate 1-carboxyvinyltransferase [Candidatus Eremiobacteraeota bacterium]|nr:3-phosphoshikimate 1-carboxyvinyltransferase [Candidatus Eremiobacteraeota bacterium]